MTANHTLVYLNQLRIAANMKPLMSWKESKEKLAAAIAKLTPAIDNAPATTVLSTLMQAAKSVDSEVRVAAARRKAEIKEQLDLEDAIKNAPVTKCAPAPALAAIKSRNDQLDNIASQRVKGDTTAKLAPAPKAKPVVATPKQVAKKASNTNIVTLADIARELGIDPKIARAKMRRVNVPADIIVGKHAYKSASKQWVVDTLQKDLRKTT